MGMSGRRRLLLPAVLLTLTLAWMAAPTYQMVWLADPSSPEAANPVTYHSWLDPLVMGYGGFHAPLTFVAVTVAAVLGWSGFVMRRPTTSVVWWSIAAVLILVGGSAILRSFAWPHGLVILLLALAVASAVWARASERGAPS